MYPECADVLPRPPIMDPLTCFQKIPIQKIQDTYEKRHDLIGVRIGYKGCMVDQSDIVNSFLVPEDSVVVFNAIEPFSATVQHQTQGPPSLREELIQAEIARRHQETEFGHDARQTANKMPTLEQWEENQYAMVLIEPPLLLMMHRAIRQLNTIQALLRR